MTNPFYSRALDVLPGSLVRSRSLEDEFALVEDGFDGVQAGILVSVGSGLLVTAFDATDLVDGTSLNFAGRTAAQDGGGGGFTYNAASVQTADDVLVFTPTAGGGRLFRDGWTVFGFSGAVAVEWGGAKGDATDESAALQRTFNAAASVRLAPGKTYSFTNLTIPNTSNWTLECPSGRATLKCIAGGDTSYGVGSYNWVTSQTFVGNPVHFRNVTFDGNSVCADVHKHMSWNSTFEFCEWTGGTTDGLVLTGANKNGVTISNTMPNTRLIQCAGRANGQHGVHITGTKPTDIQLEGGYYYDNTAGYGIYAENCAGLQMVPAPHTYNNGLGGLYLAGYGFGSVVEGGYFEDDVIIQSLNTSAKFPVFGANRHRGDIVCNFAEAGTTELRIVEPTLEDTARIVHNNNSAAKTILLDGGTSESATPIVWGGDFWTGLVDCEMHYGAGVGGYLDGRQSVMLAAHTYGPAPNQITLVKSSNAGTTTNVAVTLDVPAQQNAGTDLEIDLEVKCVSNAFADFDVYKGRFFASWTRKQASSAAIHASGLVSEIADASPGVTVAIGGWTWAGSVGNMTPTFTLTITHPAPSDQAASPIRAVVRARHRYTQAMTVA